MTMQSRRNWISYLADALMNARTMPSWEASDYLTENLFAASPNAKLLEAKVPHEEIGQLLQRIYAPIAEAASRDAGAEASSWVQVFTDISLMSETTVLVVAVSDAPDASKLLLLDRVRAWDLVFANAEAFNTWAEERYQNVRRALVGRMLAVAV